MSKKIEEIKNRNQIIIKSFVKAKNGYLDKDVTSYIGELKLLPKIELEEPFFSGIDSVNPINNQAGIIFETRMFDGSYLRPREMVELLGENDLQCHRPIKIDSSMVPIEKIIALQD
jgi:hypothetical protein